MSDISERYRAALVEADAERNIPQVRVLWSARGYPYPQGAETLAYGLDLHWYIQNVWGRIRRVTRWEAAEWLRHERYLTGK